MLAINNSSVSSQQPVVVQGARFSWVALLLVAFSSHAADEPAQSGHILTPAEAAEIQFLSAQAVFSRHPMEFEAARNFARACYTWAEFARNHSQRAQIAQQGIDAGGAAIALEPEHAAGHYYLALNLGQLARTKRLGAIRLVLEMEKAFLQALELDPNYDYGGPDRALGMLYIEAPSWITGLGNRRKGQAHLQKAAEIEPLFPENRILLIEGCLKVGDSRAAQQEWRTLEKLLPKMRDIFDGDKWREDWIDWNSRLTELNKKIHKPQRTHRLRW
jgi:hypothetical protein